MKANTRSLQKRLNYLNKLLKKNYTDEKGNNLACSLIAFEIAETLLGMGERPEIISYVAPAGVLEPKQYCGRVRWGGHVVCKSERYIFDPMVSSEGIPIERYPSLAFSNKEVHLSSMKLSSDDIEELKKAP